MHTEILPVNASNAITSALEILYSGGLVAFPTDTVYGVGALAFDGKAVKSIYTAKERPVEKAIPVLIGDREDLSKVAEEIPLFAARLIARFWPGPLTVLVPKKPALPEGVSANPAVGVRVPDHEVARTLLRLSGPLAVTSANRSSQPSPTTAQEVLQQLGGRIALILDGGRTPGGIPSTLVDCTGTEIQVLREGPITKEQMLNAI
ncbi:MAG TPA: L-threonylcarbamoyladenylate synthase [Anaerolineales bacterium]|nr:L-threonylcarbamoyladenylate synthase [Anaerolineales bacterium]